MRRRGRETTTVPGGSFEPGGVDGIGPDHRRTRPRPAPGGGPSPGTFFAVGLAQPNAPAGVGLRWVGLRARTAAAAAALWTQTTLDLAAPSGGTLGRSDLTSPSPLPLRATRGRGVRCSDEGWADPRRSTCVDLYASGRLYRAHPGLGGDPSRRRHPPPGGDSGAAAVEIGALGL